MDNFEIEDDFKKELTREEREAHDEVASTHMRSTTHRAKLAAQNIYPFAAGRNVDIVFFLLWGVFIGMTVTLAHYESYWYCCLSCSLSLLCFPIALMTPRGDFAKTLEYFLVEVGKFTLGNYIERKVRERTEHKENGVLLSIHRRLKK